MSDFLDRLGEELERSISGPTAPRSRWRGTAVAALAFAAVLALGVPWWVLGRAGESPTASSTTTSASSTTTSKVEFPIVPLPVSWGRVNHSDVFEGTQRVVLSGVDYARSEYLAVGSVVADVEASAVVLSSSDGVSWSQVETGIDPDGIAFSDIAAGNQGSVVVGVRIGGSAIFLFRSPAGEWVRGSFGSGATYGGVSVSRVVAGDLGFFVAGSALLDDEGSTAVVWRSEDGREWSTIRSGSFLGTVASANAVAVLDDNLVVGGVWSDQSGRSDAVVWRAPVSQLQKTDIWERTVLPRSDDSGFAGISAIAAGRDGVVAVGFDADSGAVWWSADGESWERVKGDFSLEGMSTRIHDVLSVPAGYVAVGTRTRGFESQKVIWVSADGRSWTRMDLEESTVLGGSVSVFDLATDGTSVVAVGTEKEPAGKGVAAVWISPPVDGVETSTPITFGSDEIDVPVVSIEPDRAVGATVITVEVVGGGIGPIPVEVNGEPACVADGVAAVKRCSFSPVDLGLSIGPHIIKVAGATDGPILDVLPEGSLVVTIDTIYQATTWPIVFAVFVRNDGAEPVDVSRWVVAEVDGDQFQFPDGTLIPPGSSAMISQAGPTGSQCPSDGGLVFRLCNYFGSDRVDDSTQIWLGGALTLFDTDGTEIARWER
ncbi:hypothetical protein BMS3Bbin02_00999 [bacterium BMS3Bbin02]|nr:hypothetical protein BMS3Bbin02_00999 [bacterium BMS3Bbin02]